MAYERPKLRGGWTSPTPYPLGQIPDSIILSVASNIVYLSAVGRKDLRGDDWGDVFAASVNGTHLKSPLGLADITLGNTAWSAKTVQSKTRPRQVGFASFQHERPLSFLLGIKMYFRMSKRRGTKSCVSGTPG